MYQDKTRQITEVRVRFALAACLGIGLVSAVPAPGASAAPVAWGEPSNGLRAAVEFLPHKAPLRHGEMFSVQFHIENVGKSDITFTTTAWQENAICTIEDSNGIEISCASIHYPGLARQVRKTLAPGRNIIVEAPSLAIAGDANEANQFAYPVGHWAVLAPGRYHVRYRLVFSGGETLDTGTLELLIASARRDEGKDARANRGEIPKEARTLMVQFLNELEDGDWKGALSFCSPAVKEKTATYPNLAEFFREFVPIQEMVGLSWIPISGGISSPKGGPSAIFSFVRFDQPDSNESISWPWSIVKENATWSIDFELVPLDMWTAQEKERLQQERQQGQARAKQVREGLEIIISPVGNRSVLGKPMPFRVELKNKGQSPIEYETSQILLNGPMIVTGPQGEVIPFIDSSCQTMSREVKLQPGETLLISDNYDVTSQYHIAKPGRYAFQLRHGHFGERSNIVEADIEGGELSPRENIVEAPAAILPFDWQLTRTMTSHKGPDQNVENQILLVGLFGRWSQKGPGVSISLAVILDGGQGEIEPGDHYGELWGRSKWGLVYGQSIEAEILWPGWKEDIFRALGIH